MRTVDTGALRGELIRSHAILSRTYREGRVCFAEGCSTRLSIYNGSRLCWQHEPLRVYSMRVYKKRRRAA